MLILSENEVRILSEVYCCFYKVQQPLNKTTDSDQSSENTSRETRETRAHSAPDLQCSIEAGGDQTGADVWSVDVNTSDPLVSSGATSTTVTPVVPAAVYNATTVSTATKARTKSYATTQDGSRLSYCEVATGIESVSKNENDCQVGIIRAIARLIQACFTKSSCGGRLYEQWIPVSTGK